MRVCRPPPSCFFSFVCLFKCQKGRETRAIGRGGGRGGDDDESATGGNNKETRGSCINFTIELFKIKRR